MFDNFDHMLLSHGIWSQRSLKNRRVKGLNFAIPTYLGIELIFEPKLNKNERSLLSHEARSFFTRKLIFSPLHKWSSLFNKRTDQNVQSHCDGHANSVGGISSVVSSVQETNNFLNHPCHFCLVC